MPLAVYFFVLAQLNRRPHPVFVSGGWDFAGVLFALSGFLLLGGPFIMATLNQDLRDVWVWTPHRSLEGLFEGLSEGWYYLRLAIWALYFLAMAGGSIFLLRRRSKITSVYNVASEVFDHSLEEVLNQIQIPWRRSGNRVFLGLTTLADGEALSDRKSHGHSQTGVRGSSIEGSDLKVEDRKLAVVTPSDEQLVADGRSLKPKPISSTSLARFANTQQENPVTKSVLEIDPFPAMHHVTLRWPDGIEPIRHEVEESLAKSLAEVEPTYNPAVTWLMSVATVLLSAVSFGLVIMILFVFFVYYGN
jgi:hypothetical protein